jgi:hypothetical protein
VCECVVARRHRHMYLFFAGRLIGYVMSAFERPRYFHEARLVISGVQFCSIVLAYNANAASTK